MCPDVHSPGESLRSGGTAEKTEEEEEKNVSEVCEPQREEREKGVCVYISPADAQPHVPLRHSTDPLVPFTQVRSLCFFLQ